LAEIVRRGASGGRARPASGRAHIFSANARAKGASSQSAMSCADAYIAAKFMLDHTVQTQSTMIPDEMMILVGVLSRSKRSASIPPSMVLRAGTDFG
jgi:hypothetical protein